jgi:hypothetical protein
VFHLPDNVIKVINFKVKKHKCKYMMVVYQIKS